MRDNEIDNQIDEAAQRLTAGEPGGDLRARVLARIDGEGPAKAGHHVLSRYPAVVSGFSRTRWIAVPVALAAALVIAVWSTRPVSEVHEVHEVPQLQPVNEVPQVAEVQHTSTVNRVNPVNRLNPVNPVSPVNPVTESPFAPASLDIAPITIDAIPPAQAIVVADLSVAPIEVRAIDESVQPDALAQ